MSIATALVGAVLIAWIIIFLESRRHMPIRPSEVGCYRGSQEFSDISLDITRDGMLKFSDAAVAVHLANDKTGDSFEPKRRIVVDLQKHALSVVQGYPELLRINDDGSFYIPTNDSKLILFVSCERT
jgi:hypothetical protein